MAWRFRLAPEQNNFDFFRWQWITFGGSLALSALSIVVWVFMGLNFGIDFKGGTTIRTESTMPVDVGAYRKALEGLPLGDISVTTVATDAFETEPTVAMVRIAALDAQEAVTPEQIQQVEKSELLLNLQKAPCFLTGWSATHRRKMAN